MKEDTRDAELGEALDRAVSHIDPDPESRLRPVLRRGGVRRAIRWGAGAVALGVFVSGLGVGAVLLTRERESLPADRDRRGEETVEPSPTPESRSPEPRPPLADPWGDLPSGISGLSPPPISRIGPALVWTGHEFVVWGGAIHDGAERFADGFSFNAETREWETLPPSPLGARYFPGAVWTGREVLIWGGWDGGSGFFEDGAAYDPATGAWRLLAPSPLDARFPRGTVWTGTEMIVWGSGPPMDRRDTTGAAYNPETDSWRLISDGPFPVNWGSVVWTGDEMVVLGASVHGPNRSDTPNAVAAVYDPDADSWSELPPTGLDPNGTFGVWAGRSLVAIDYNHQVREYDFTGGGWRTLPSIPLDDGEEWPALAAANGHIFVNTFSGPAAFELRTQKWSVDIPVRHGRLQPVAAGDIVVLWEPNDDGEPPDALLVWKPGD